MKPFQALQIVHYMAIIQAVNFLQKLSKWIRWGYNIPLLFNQTIIWNSMGVTPKGEENHVSLA